MEGLFYTDDNSMPDNWAPSICTALTYKAIEQAGGKFYTKEDVEKFVTDAGFVDVQAFLFKVPYGPWPKHKDLKQAGMLNLINAESSFHAYSMALHTRVLGMSEQKSRQVCDDARDAILYTSRKDKVHQYTTW